MVPNREKFLVNFSVQWRLGHWAVLTNDRQTAFFASSNKASNSQRGVGRVVILRTQEVCDFSFSLELSLKLFPWPVHIRL